MRILAIDPATVCGWADSNGQRGIWNLEILVPKTHEGYRHVALQRTLLAKTESVKYDLIAIERAAFGAMNQRRTAAFHSSLAGIITLVAALKQIPLLWANPSEVKKFATGMGNAKKQAMIDAAKRAGENIIDDNVADAYWVLKWAEKEVRIRNHVDRSSRR